MIDRLVLKVFNWHFDPLTLDQYHELAEELAKSFGRLVRSGPLMNIIKVNLQPGGTGRLALSYESGSRTVRLTLSLNLNATRLLRGSLAAKHPSVNTGIANDRKINWIPPEAAKRFGYKTLADLGVEITAELINNFLSSVDRVTSCVSQADLLQSTEPSIAIQEIEVYWDIPKQRALSYVDSLESDFSSFFRSSQVASYPSYSDAKTRDYNSFCVSGSFRVGERHKIYAKTPSLVRFESLFKKPRIRQLCGGSNRLSNDLAESIHTMLQPLATCSASVLDQFLVALPPTARTVSATKLLFDLAQCCRDPKMLETVLEMLAVNGKITSQPHLYKLIDRMFKKGLVRRVRRGVYQMPRHKRRLLRSLLQTLDPDLIKRA